MIDRDLVDFGHADRLPGATEDEIAVLQADVFAPLTDTEVTTILATQ